MRFIVYLIALFVVGSAVAQNPTILQGNYISNVYGEANFIKNPNAQTNVANVTVSSAVVTRSTTTPLVATSKFLVTFSAGGTATWSTRSFDAGMKNQNCEARFTYKGFLATSKAQVFQGANKVAELALSPTGTDPRIASINFPCGDLSAPTTFVLTDSAINSGTNEIGGIYVGLATNQANVAQAEFVGATELTNCVTQHSVTSTSFASFNAVTCTRNNFGAATTSTNDLSITIPNAKPGWYFVKFNGIPYSTASSSANCYWSLKEDVSGYTGGGAYANSPAGFGTSISGGQLTSDLNITTTGSRTWRVVGKSTTGSCYVDASSAINSTVISVFRYPSSSELVVTPERQNVFAGIKGVAGGFTNLVNTNSWTKLTSSTTLTRTTYGKAKVETNNDYSITVENMPVGNYFVSVTNRFHAAANGAGDRTVCAFAIADSATGGPQIAGIQIDAYGDASSTTQAMLGSTITGIYVNSSVATKTFFVQANRIVGLGDCKGYSDSYGGLTITLTPLDQPSNSALYVQGPVLGAQTGATIGSGYVGEKVTWSSAPSDYNLTTTEADWTNATITLTPGVWYISAQLNVLASADAVQGNDIECQFKLTDSANNLINNQSRTKRVRTVANYVMVNTDVLSLSTVVNVSTSTTYKIRAKKVYNIGTGGCTVYYQTANYSDFYAIRLN